MFFRNKQDEFLAEKYLIKARVSYERSDTVDMLDTFAKQEWSHTGQVTIK